MLKCCCRRQCCGRCVEAMLEKTLLKWCCRKHSSKKTSASMASKCTSTFLFICLFFTPIFLFRCSRWWRACLVYHRVLHLRKNKEMTTSLPARCHLLTWKKNKEMTTSWGGSPSSVAPKEKKSKEMTTCQGGSPSSSTPEKNAEDANELGGTRLIVISWVFSQLWVH